jgi:hypothetical protein
MDQLNSMSKLAGRAGSLFAIVGLLMFFSGVFSFAPRTFLFAGVALYALALVAYFVEESGQRRYIAGSQEK